MSCSSIQIKLSQKNCLLFLYFLLPFLYSAQITSFKNYTQQDGLNSTFGYLIKQDPQGFIWIGGDNGLFRFDGAEFKQYNENSGLKNIEIIGCEPLSSGEFFIFPFQSPVEYFKNNKLFTQENDAELKKLQLGNGIPLFFCNADKSQLFICNPIYPKFIYIFKNGKISEFPVVYDPLKSGEPPNCIFYNFLTGNLYFHVYASGIYAYNIYTKKKIWCDLPPEDSKDLRSASRFFLGKKKECVNVYKLISPTHLRKVGSFRVPGKIYYIKIDRYDKLWVCLQEGGALYFAQPLEDSITYTKPLKLLEEYMINDLFRDRDGNMWFNTKNNGLFFMPDKLFNNYVRWPVKNNSSYFTCIAANKASVFLGHNKSVGSIYQSRNIKEISLDKNSKFECRDIYANDKIVIFGEAKDGFLLDLSTYKIKKHNKLKGIKKIVPYTANSVLICSNTSLYEYNFESDKISQLLRGKIYTALPFNPDSLFVGHFKDLYKFNIHDKKATIFLKDYFFTDLKKLGPNLYIAATRLNGIILFDNHKIVRSITQDHGLASNQVKKIEVENENTVWACTSQGLTRIDFNKGETTINNFTRIDGLPSDKVSDCIIKNDTIYVATSGGLGIFPINELKSQDKLIDKSVIINSVSFGGKEYSDPKEAFTATYPDNTIIFNLSFLDYASQGRISYRYKTEGLNEDWQISQSSKVILNSLPPGKYTFKVYGLGYNDRRSNQFTAFSFEIEPKFWQSSWFHILIALVLTTAAILLITAMLKKRRDKKLKSLLYEKRIAELELQAIKAQINPHFIYNCLNSIKFLLYKKDYEETENYLDIFSRMIRKTLLYSEKTFMPIHEEINYLSLYLDMETLRFSGHFTYAIELASNVNRDGEIPSLLIQPFVENAIKHGINRIQGREGRIEVCFEYNEVLLTIIIRDNGVGIGNSLPKANKSDSFGIKLSKKRIEAFRQLFDTDIIMEIIDLSQKGKQGTEIKLHLNPFYI